MWHRFLRESKLRCERCISYGSNEWQPVYLLDMQPYIMDQNGIKSKTFEEKSPKLLVKKKLNKFRNPSPHFAPTTQGLWHLESCPQLHLTPTLLIF